MCDSAQISQGLCTTIALHFAVPVVANAIASPVSIAKRDSHMNREISRRTLAQRLGGATDAKAVAEAAISIWHDASIRLAPVIGGQGVDVLLRRSLHIAGRTLPCLAVAGHAGSSSELLAVLQARLAGCETALAIEASNTFLVTFTELLASLIGQSLTERLLAPIWAPPLPTSEPESTS